MNRAIAATALTVMMVMLAGAGTFAFFSDIVTSTGNTFTAAALEIYLENNGTGRNIPLFSTDGYTYDGQTYPADGEFYPGRGPITKTLRVHNSLSSSINARMCGFSATFYGDFALAQGLMIRICEVDPYSGSSLSPPLYEGVLNNLEAGVSLSGVLGIIPGGSLDLRISIWMPEDAPDPNYDVNGDGLLNDNDYQGLSMTADISVTAIQA